MAVDDSTYLLLHSVILLLASSMRSVQSIDNFNEAIAAQVFFGDRQLPLHMQDRCSTGARY